MNYKMENFKYFLANPTKKVVVLGDSGVGKTSIVNRFTENYYLPRIKATIGTDFRSRDIIVAGVNVTLQIWDTAGQEIYNSLGGSYCQGADCCILVFDITEPKSFKNVEKWKEEFLCHARLTKFDDFPFIVIGNKIDINSHSVSEESVQAWCMRNHNIPYFEVSAKKNLNIQTAFNQIPKIIMKKIVVHDEHNNIKSNTVNLKKNKHKSRCCFCCC